MKLSNISPAIAVFLTLWTAVSLGANQQQFETDLFQIGDDRLEVTFIGHGTLMLNFNEQIIQVDPWSRLADYRLFPDPSLILITHEHGDHLDLEALHHCRKDDTAVVLTELCSQKVSGGIIMKNGDTRIIKGIKIEAVPAYNIKHKRSNGDPYHPRGDGNGYILTLGEEAFRIYIAGDTENIPEMGNISDIDIAFLPMNLPYTMTPEMVAEAARTFRPSVLYPYHFGDTDTNELVQLLSDDPDIEVRIRSME